MLVHLGLSIWAMLPNQRAGKGYYGDEEEGDEEMNDDASPIGETKDGAAVRMQQMHIPRSPQPIFTPRTQAFHSLDGSLPVGRR